MARLRALKGVPAGVVGLLALGAGWQVQPTNLLVSVGTSTTQPGCAHAGPVVSGDDVLAPIEQGLTDQIRTGWLRHLPVETFGPRRARVRVSFRVDEAGRVTSACVTAGVRDVIDTAVVASLLELPFEPAVRDGRPVPTVVERDIDLIRPEGSSPPSSSSTRPISRGSRRWAGIPWRCPPWRTRRSCVT